MPSYLVSGFLRQILTSTHVLFKWITIEGATKLNGYCNFSLAICLITVFLSPSPISHAQTKKQNHTDTKNKENKTKLP